jgi:hypothetical protein
VVVTVVVMVAATMVKIDMVEEGVGDMEVVVDMDVPPMVARATTEGAVPGKTNLDFMVI